MENEDPKKRSINGPNDIHSESVNGNATTKSQDGSSCGGDVTLKAKMSLLNGCTVIVVSIIGSGIFVSPTGVLMHTGSVNMALIVWIISGIFSMVCCSIKHNIFLYKQQDKISKINHSCQHYITIYFLGAYETSSNIFGHSI